MAYYRMGVWDVQLKLNNLLDRRYIVAGHGSSPNLNLPGAPRSAQVVARYRSKKMSAIRPSIKAEPGMSGEPITPRPAKSGGGHCLFRRAGIGRSFSNGCAASMPGWVSGVPPGLLFFGATGLLLNHRATMKIPSALRMTNYPVAAQSGAAACRY